MAREVFAGETITLYAEFYILDETGNKTLQDPDSTPLVSIYDALHDPRSSSTDLDDDALVYQDSATQVTTGIWKYEYLVPDDQMTNWWFDLWEATVDSIAGQAVMQFFVIGDDVDDLVLGENLLVTVTLDSSIEDIDGNTLEDDYEFHFTTVLSPMYSDPRLLKLYGGTWVSEVSDETLSLMAYLASLEADLITPAVGRKYNRVFLEARKNFTTYLALNKLLELPLNIGGQTKQLADFLVKRDGAAFIDMLNRLQQEKLKWELVVNRGGTVGPGESFGPVITVKGIYDPDRRQIGRLWMQPTREAPYVNGKKQGDGILYYFTKK